MSALVMMAWSDRFLVGVSLHFSSRDWSIASSTWLMPCFALNNIYIPRRLECTDLS